MECDVEEMRKYLALLLIFFINTTIYTSCVFIDTYEMNPVTSDENSYHLNTNKTVSMTTDLMNTVFKENKGQIKNSDVLFYTSNSDATIGFLRNGIIITNKNHYMTNNLENMRTLNLLDSNTSKEELKEQIRIQFIDANIVIPQGRNPTNWTTTFFYNSGSTFSGITIINFQEIVYTNVWKGVDISYLMDNHGLKYNIIVHPYAEITAIKFKVTGHLDMKLNNEDTLVIHTLSGKEIIDSGLDVYYSEDHSSKIKARFTLNFDTYSFNLAEWDVTRAIVIDPLIYSTYIGGNNVDNALGIVVDSFGCMYIAGCTESTDFPTTTDAFDTTSNGDSDIFIAKLSHNGSSLEYSTILGGSGYEYCRDMTLDNNGCVYIIGDTNSSDFPTTPGSFDTTFNGVYDIIITKLNKNGNALIYSTYLGGNGYEYGYSISVDLMGCAYIAGNAYGSEYQDWDVIIRKISANGDSVLLSSYFGGSDSDIAENLDIDTTGNIYITGYTYSTNFPISSDAYDKTFNGYNAYSDAFVVKLSYKAGSLVYSTFLGGWYPDVGYDIAVDNKGCAIITGYSMSDDFPVTANALNQIYQIHGDVFLTKLSPDGNSIIYSTFLSGNGYDYGYSVDLDIFNNAYITGVTGSTNFPTTTNGFSLINKGELDVFVSRINLNNYTLIYSTYIGGGDTDTGNCIVSDNRGFVYVSGSSQSSDFPTTINAYDASANINTNGFITKIATDTILPLAVAGPDINIDEDTPLIFNGGFSSDDMVIVNYTWTCNCSIESFSIYGIMPNHTFPSPGLYNISLKVTDGVGNYALDSLIVSVNDITAPIAIIGPDRTVSEGSLVILNGSASTDNNVIVNYTWTFNDDNSVIILYGMNTEYIFNRPGGYTILLNVTDAVGLWNIDTMSINVTDVTKPIADAGLFQNVDPGCIVFFNGSGSTDNVQIINYSWTFRYNGTNVTLFGVSTEFKFVMSGNYTITLTVSDAAGNIATDIVHISINPILGPESEANHDFPSNVWIYLFFIFIIILIAILIFVMRHQYNL